MFMIDNIIPVSIALILDDFKISKLGTNNAVVEFDL